MHFPKNGRGQYTLDGYMLVSACSVDLFSHVESWHKVLEIAGQFSGILEEVSV